MRVILFLLFSLAIGKVAAHQYIQQQAAENTIINAYREHALAACQKFSVPASGTTTPVKIKLVIGRHDLNVRLWQTSHSKWSARYQDPVLIITSRNAWLLDELSGWIRCFWVVGFLLNPVGRAFPVDVTGGGQGRAL